ncbi:MAG: GntR family transcriptional regulator, partial [Clostridiaceae bacterium]|nr:GntR family transcriptional regulator [Clostridiaceae bacterium]
MKQTSLIDSVEKRISDMIFVTNEFRPQDKLPNERTLAEQFSVSRNTIRESIKSLEAKGVLTVKHGSGTYVRRLPGLRDDPFGFMEMEDKYQLMKDLYEVRSILEPEAAAIVTQRATDEEIKK